MEKRLFTSESVTEGHPDKICDAISDAILDALLEQDPMSRVACETCTTTGYVMVMGEITSNAHIDFQQVVRDTVREIGYDRAKYGFDADTCAVVTAIDKQSTDIAMGVDKALEAKENNMSDEEIDAIGAGDQGMMFGFATNETEEYMPYPIYMAHKLARQLTKVRKDGTLTYLRPDGKTQVTVEYDENGKPFRLDAVVLSTQHDPEVSQEQIHADIKQYVFDEIIPAHMVDENTKFFINPTGRFVIGGPQGDSGLTGRKIIVDSYGGWVESSSVNGADFYSRSQGYASRRSADYLLRIPSVSFETLMGSLTELGNVPYSHTYTENVTARYYDAQARLTAYTAQETRLLEMMEKAQTVPDVIAIEEKITELRYQIESLQSSLKNWDRQVTYSSVNVSLQEVREYSPESEISYGQRLWLALKDGLASVGDFFKDLLVFLVGALPALAVLSLLALILVPVGKKLSARRKARKQAEKENQDK